jgi:hypothetical protein
VRLLAGGLHALGVRRAATVGLMLTNPPAAKYAAEIEQLYR